MKYYVVADIHGFYTELRSALDEKGFFSDTEPRKLIICGDLFDRGREAPQLQAFIVELMKNDEVILIRGNHEDLMLELIDDWESKAYLLSYHNSNGTVDTVLQLTETPGLYPVNAARVRQKLIETPFLAEIIPAMLDYYETENYVFVHGWIPCQMLGSGGRLSVYSAIDGWREASRTAWQTARWLNGMEAARQGVTEKGKTIVCGHYHTSYGHSKIEGACTEFGDDADFSPYKADGIIAIDSCTARTHKVNCIVIDD